MNECIYIDAIEREAKRKRNAHCKRVKGERELTCRVIKPVELIERFARALVDGAQIQRAGEVDRRTRYGSIRRADDDSEYRIKIIHIYSYSRK